MSNVGVCSVEKMILFFRFQSSVWHSTKAGARMTKLPTKLAPRLVPFRAETETETETDTELARPKRTLAAPTNLRYGSEKIERERERESVC